MTQRRIAKHLISALLTLCALLAFTGKAAAQGCVQSRGAGTGVLLQGEDSYLQAGEWQASVGYRWLHSDKHYVGGIEQKQRQEEGSDVRNDSHFIDVGITYGITERISLTLTVPFVDSVRSSLYEHDRTNRHTTSASGLADVRLTTLIWLLDPKSHANGNIAFGAGIKLPTGDAETTSIRYKTNGPALAYNDQSIQPGDGGWGIIIETQGFQKIFDQAYAYMQASYLINPDTKNKATGFSTPDSYLLRAGLSYGVWPSKGLSLSLGGRMEGVPTTDWIGNSEGSRRPGFSISIEPGITWVYKKWALNVTAPVAIERNREWSVSDRVQKPKPGKPFKQGDAAFADYIITSSISYRF